MKQRLLGSLVSALAVLTSTPLIAAEPGLPLVRYVESGITASSWPMYVAREKRLFEKNGIQVESIVIRGAANTVRTVISGTAQAGRVNSDRVIEAAEKGAKTKIIAGALHQIPYDLIARPAIKRGQDLKGKTIAVDSLTGGSTLMFKEVVQKAFGLTDKDYKFLVVGTSPDRFAALKGGSVDASFFGPPFNFQAPVEGFTKLVSFPPILGPIANVVEFVYSDYLRTNRKEVVALVKSLIEAQRWIYDPANKKEAFSIYTKILKRPVEEAEDVYNYLITELQAFPKDGSITRKAIEKTMDLRVQGGKYEGRKPPFYGDFIESSVIEEAQKQLGLPIAAIR